jgi:CheY-like chemotaxis protein
MTVDISSDKTAHQDFLLGGGEIAEFIRRADWSATALGPIETWPQSLCTTVSLCLASNFPINIIWGPDHLQIYNEGYRVVCEDAHPRLAAGMALVVDDEDLVRASTADMLIDLGYSVIEANCAASALKLVDEGLQPDVLITDHLMPGMTGTELARKLKARRPQMPVVIVSGFAEVESIAFDLPRLAKPYRNAELAAILASLTAAVD